MAKKQTDTGKALEYCFAAAYYKDLSALKLNVVLLRDVNYLKAQASYNTFSLLEQNLFYSAAKSTIASMVKLEPGLITQIDKTDILEISIAADAAGKVGDVRDVLFKRNGWVVGFSVKNNHDAAKHSRLSPKIDFGLEWLGHPCSSKYFSEIDVVFNAIRSTKRADPLATWASYPNKEATVYVPILDAFKKELLDLNNSHPDIPKKLLSYLIGRNSFYKVIKRDIFNLVVIKGYNMNKDLGLSYNSVPSVCGIPNITYPTRIIEFISNNNTTLFMTLDKGWQISFRIHSARTLLEDSLKFDINLIGNPPILFTHYMF
ncbi:MAG: restriction endonuclease [Mucilaginibacter sp.]|nr:restriction endonuclease [Mucilaginibacter sp.]